MRSSCFICLLVLLLQHASAVPVFTEVTTINADLAGPVSEKDGGIAFCDLNNDGCLDVIYNTFEAFSGSRVVLNDGPGGGACSLDSWTDVTPTALRDPVDPNVIEDSVHERQVACADFNHDGLMDFVINTNTEVLLWRNDGISMGVPSFSVASSFLNCGSCTPPTMPSPVILDQMNAEQIGWMDVNHDGALDLIIDNHDQGVFIGLNDLMNLGTLSILDEMSTMALGFETCRNMPPASAAQCTGPSGDYGAVADLNGDGCTDLIGRKENGRNLYTFNTGTNVYDLDTNFNFHADNDHKGAVAVCDFDNDDVFELIWTGSNNDALSETTLWRLLAGVWTPQSIGNTPGMAGIPIESAIISWTGAACADVNNDGFVDLVLTTDRSDFDILLLNDPLNPMMFTAENIPNSNTPSQAVALGDVDLDGKVDMIINKGSSTSSSANQLYRNQNTDNPMHHLTIRAFTRIGMAMSQLLGARLRLLDQNANVISGARESSGGRGHGSQDPWGTHFGIESSFTFATDSIYISVTPPTCGAAAPLIRTLCQSEFPTDHIYEFVIEDGEDLRFCGAVEDFFRVTPGIATDLDVLANDVNAAMDRTTLSIAVAPVGGTAVAMVPPSVAPGSEVVQFTADGTSSFVTFEYEICETVYGACTDVLVSVGVGFVTINGVSQSNGRVEMYFESLVEYSLFTSTPGGVCIEYEDADELAQPTLPIRTGLPDQGSFMWTPRWLFTTEGGVLRAFECDDPTNFIEHTDITVVVRRIS